MNSVLFSDRAENFAKESLLPREQLKKKKGEDGHRKKCILSPRLFGGGLNNFRSLHFDTSNGFHDYF